MTSSKVLEPIIKENTSTSTSKTNLLIDSLWAEYVNDALFADEDILSFENFKLNFRDAWIPAENHFAKKKSELHSKFLSVYNAI